MSAGVLAKSHSAISPGTYRRIRVVQKVLHRITLLVHDLGKDLCETRDAREVVLLQCRELPQRRVERIGQIRVGLVGVERICMRSSTNQFSEPRKAIFPPGGMEGIPMGCFAYLLTSRSRLLPLNGARAPCSSDAA
jgi:hypothetical protein